MGKHSFRGVALGCLAVVVPSLLAAQDAAPPEHYRLRLEYVRWLPTLDAQVRKSTSDVPGTEIDVKDVLGVEDTNAGELRGVLRLGARHKLRGSYVPMDYDGDVSLEIPFTFDGSFFRSGERTVTSLKGALWSAEYEFDLVQNGVAHLGLLIGAKYLDVDSVIVQPEIGRRESGTQRAPVPVLGATGRLYAGRISLSAEVSGLTIGDRGSLYDVEAQARFHLSDRIAVGGGYRLLSVRGEDEGDFIHLRDTGVRFGVELSL